MRRFLLTAGIAALASGAVQAQDATDAEQLSDSEKIGQGEIRAIDSWTYDDIYADGWSVDEMLDDVEVVGADGEEIGDVENVMFDAEGKILAVIAEVGGFWDIGDTHVSVPWDQVEVGDGSIAVPVTEENVEEFSIFGEGGFYHEEAAQDVQQVDDDLTAGAGVFKATDLIGDYAYLTGGERYGYVDDVVVREGAIEAVVIDAGAYGTPGYYAYPYRGYGYGYAEGGMDAGYGTGYGPGNWRYDVGYDADEITVIDTFDPDRMGGGGTESGG